jgi:MFS family permease
MTRSLATPLARRHAATIFLAFAFVYFFSALLRAVTATLAPVFAAELGIGAADLGLLAGAYFLGFAAMQLPLGAALDRHGPKRVLVLLLMAGAAGCAGFALARDLGMLVLTRVAIGIGVSACLMAPLTFFRHVYSPAAQLRANSWMLMTGSLGMLASTVPVQWLLPVLGWRGLFWTLAACLVLSVVVIAIAVPAASVPSAQPAHVVVRYRDIVRHPLFLRLAPLGFFVYGGMIAIQALWAGPWLTRVAGWSSTEAAAGLFGINLSMLFTFMTWGAVMPRLVVRGVGAVRLMTWGVPLSLGLLAVNIALGSRAGAAAWALWCMSCTFVSLSQPAVGQSFPAAHSGRALSAFNLVIFSGVFALQWGIGLVVDAFVAWGYGVEAAFRWAFASFGLCCVVSYLWFLSPGCDRPDNAS